MTDRALHAPEPATVGQKRAVVFRGYHVAFMTTVCPNLCSISRIRGAALHALGGELGSRSHAGAAPATVAERKSRRQPLGIGLGRCRDRPEGQLRSPETSLDLLELDRSRWAIKRRESMALGFSARTARRSSANHHGRSLPLGRKACGWMRGSRCGSGSKAADRAIPWTNAFTPIPISSGSIWG